MQSRCTRFRFSPLKSTLIKSRVKEVVLCENVELTSEGLTAALRLGKGDMRKVLNIIQATALAHDNRVCEDSVYRCTGMPTENDIRKCQNALFNLSVKEAYSVINEIQIVHSLALIDILTSISELIVALKLPPLVRVMIIKNMAEIEYALSMGASEQLQLGALVSIFFQARCSFTDKSIVRDTEKGESHKCPMEVE